MNTWIEPLLAAASKAPSGDNTQPWRFVVEGDAVGLETVDSRDPSPMNAGGRMSRIALGAALENLLRAADSLGLKTAIDPEPGPFLARVRILDSPETVGSIDPRLTARSTNRREYDGRPIEPELLTRLTGETPGLENVVTQWIVGVDRLKAIAEVVGRADGLMLGNPAMRSAFLSKVRFDRPALEPVDEGLSLASLELKTSDRVALQIIKRTPDLLLRLGNASSVFTAKSRQLVVSSSGVCMVTAKDNEATTDLNVGRAMQRAWLALTAERLAAQPIMSLPLLDNTRTHGTNAMQLALGAARIDALLDEFRALVPELGGGRPAWLMRFGTASPPSGRTGRLPLSGMTTYNR